MTQKRDDSSSDVLTLKKDLNMNIELFLNSLSLNLIPNNSFDRLNPKIEHTEQK